MLGGFERCMATAWNARLPTPAIPPSPPTRVSGCGIYGRAVLGDEEFDAERALAINGAAGGASIAEEGLDRTEGCSGLKVVVI